MSVLLLHHIKALASHEPRLPLSNVRPRTERRVPASEKKGFDMNFTVIHIGPLVSLIAGILILIMPRLLNYIIALYLIIIGLIGLFGTR